MEALLAEMRDDLAASRHAQEEILHELASLRDEVKELKLQNSSAVRKSFNASDARHLGCATSSTADADNASDQQPESAQPAEAATESSAQPSTQPLSTTPADSAHRGVARHLSTLASEACSGFDPSTIARFHLYDLDEDETPPLAEAPPAPSVHARDIFFLECCDFLLRSGGPPRLDERDKLAVLEQWLAGPRGRVFLSEQSYHVEAAMERAREGAHGKELLGWLRIVDVACKEVGPREAQLAPGDLFGADQLQPLFDYVLVHCRPAVAFTTLSRVLDMVKSELDNEWLNSTPAADHARMYYQVSVSCIVSSAIRRWRHKRRDSALYAALADAPVLLSGGMAMNPPPLAGLTAAEVVDAVVVD